MQISSARYKLDSMFSHAVLALLVGCLISQVLCGSDSQHWSYDGRHGPKNWPKYFPTCGHKRQSPVDINTTHALQEEFQDITYKGFEDTPASMTLKNNGHSVVLKLSDGDLPAIAGGGLKDEYLFTQLHFHWGAVSSRGSEHTVDGRRYPMEMHIVHYNSKYNNLDRALNMDDGLAVIGVLFELQDKDNDAMTDVTKVLERVKTEGQVTTVDNRFPLGQLLPANRQAFYRYQGSLTTPICNQVVTWTVLEHSVQISERQMRKFRTLTHDADGHATYTVDNFRPTLPLHGRAVSWRFTSVAAACHPSRQLLLVSLLLLACRWFRTY